MGYVLSAKIVIPHQSCHNKVFEKYSPEWGLYGMQARMNDRERGYRKFWDTVLTDYGTGEFD